ncbi:dynein axonemal light chain 1 [Chrysoperla carnea]|uniref:dynein axonemal light chain 1 n=1 Tax=Chrysoperla carnea TaxID=189513 RepID=UPI001D077EAE|nr:dynein axonemal light chain 1 [Chrysoperla carnea]
MSKATTIKDVLKNWQEKNHGIKLENAKEVNLQFQWPPIEKMDNSFSVLQNCEKLSLSTNMIEKISGISSLKNLKILSVPRNYIKSFAGLESLGETLEQLWISYNLIEKTRGIENLQKLKVLYISNNLIKEWKEYDRFATCPLLEDLVFSGNPLYESIESEKYVLEAIRRIPTLKKVEGEPVVAPDEDVSISDEQQT